MQEWGYALLLLAGFVVVGMLIETHTRMRSLQEKMDRMHGHLLQLMDRQGLPPH